MWGTFLSEPLLIVALVGRCPANQLIRRMPIRARISPFTGLPCREPAYGVLDHISMDYPPAAGRSHTRYSPVRRSPASEASFTPAAPRLACVKPVASVHPEPGSNSPLLFIFFSFFSLIKNTDRSVPTDGCFLTGASAPCAYLVSLSHYFNVLCALPSLSCAALRDVPVLALRVQRYSKSYYPPNFFTTFLC